MNVRRLRRQWRSIGDYSAWRMRSPGSRCACCHTTKQLLSLLLNLTKATADGTDVVTAGAVVVLQKDNLLMCRVNSADSDAQCLQEWRD